MEFRHFYGAPSTFSDFFIVVMERVRPRVVPFTKNERRAISQRVDCFSFSYLHRRVPHVATIQWFCPGRRASVKVNALCVDERVFFCYIARSVASVDMWSTVFLSVSFGIVVPRMRYRFALYGKEYVGINKSFGRVRFDGSVVVTSRPYRARS